MFRKLLIATDGSSHSERAAEAAINLAKDLPDAKVCIIHVLKTMPPRQELVQVNFDVKRLLEEKMQKKMPKTVASFIRAGISYTIHAAVGDPAEEIVNYAKEESVDLIIIGSRGLNTLGEVLLGSVSHKVAHESHCPVMIVK